METKIAFPRLLLAAALIASACRGKHSPPAVQNEEPAPGTRLETSLKMSDPAAPTQLIRGFYGLENNSWRWTAGSFSVVLRPPPESGQRGAVLKLALNVPDLVIGKLGPVTLSASVGGTKLSSQKYAAPGAATYTADVPAALLAKDSVSIDFSLDKSLPPGSVDQRELGVVATEVGLETK